MLRSHKALAEIVAQRPGYCDRGKDLIMRPFRMLGSLMTVVVMVLPAGYARGDSFTWTGKGDNSTWEDARNWNPNSRFPGDGSAADDEASIARADGTPGHVRLQRGVALKQLNLGDNMRLEGG